MKIKLLILIFMLLLQFSLVSADDHDEVKVFDLELEKLLNLGSAVLAAALCIVTFIAYRRSENKRLVYVALAFFLFAIKSALTGAEIFFGEWAWIDPIASFFDFAILLSFFFGVFLVNMRK